VQLQVEREERMNKAFLKGRLTKDPEVRYTQNNTLVATFTIAVNRREKDKADFINCIAWGKTGEFVSKYFKKGQEILAVGRIQVRDYDKDGHKVYVTEVIVEEVEFCGNKEKGNEQIEVNYVDSPDDSLPF
jgi:single-strand DNA-binding protein